MEHDGYSLDDKRQKVPANDIPDLLDCWLHRRETKFTQKRTQRLADLQRQIAPLKWVSLLQVTHHNPLDPKAAMEANLPKQQLAETKEISATAEQPV